SCRNNCMIDQLPDDILIAILSRMGVEEAVRTSVLSSRWRYLWKHTSIYNSETLEFDDMYTDTGTKMDETKFKDLVNHVLKSHQGPLVESFIIRYGNVRDRSIDIDKWIYFAMRKEVESFELNFSSCDVWLDFGYKFPEFLLSHSSCSTPSFQFLRSLVLVEVDIEDEVVRYFLDSCYHIEEVCIIGSNTTKNVEVVGRSPFLRELEISECWNMQSIKISAKYIFCLTYQGSEISLQIERTPMFFELALGGEFCESFIYEPNKHSSYSFQLKNLALILQAEFPFGRERTIAPADLPRLHALERLELNIESQVGRSLLFFTSLIKASPRLREFRIQVNVFTAKLHSYSPRIRIMMPFPEVSTVESNGVDHKNLKVVTMVGYCGCASEEDFLVQLSKMAEQSLEKIVIDTNCDYYLNTDWVMYRVTEEEWEKPIENNKQKNTTMTRFHAKIHAEKLASSIASKIKFLIT
ncbi:hypothetical protein MIMGU_mgv1a023061mg, partial [Erythranthe guttata]